MARYEATVTILSEMPTGMGCKWVLVQYKEDFFGYGFKQDLYTLTGFPVEQCGTRKDVLKHFESIADLCKRNIEKYQKELTKSKNPNRWNIMIEHKQKELEMLIEFAKILNN